MYDVFAGAKYVISAEMTTYEGKRYLRMVFQDGFMPQYEIGDEIVKSELYFPAPTIQDSDDLRGVNHFLNQLAIDYAKNGLVDDILKSMQEKFLDKISDFRVIDTLSSLNTHGEVLAGIYAAWKEKICSELTLALDYVEFDDDELEKVAEGRIDEMLVMSFVHAIYSNSNIETKLDIDDSLLRFIFKKHHRYYNGKLEDVLESIAFKDYGNTSYVRPFVYIAEGDDIFKYNEIINEIISIYIGFFFGYFHSKTLHALVSVRVSRQKELIQAYRGVKTTIQSLEKVAKDMEQES